MFKCAKRFVLLLALVMLPVQAMATALSGLVCNSDGRENMTHVAHANDGHGHSAQRDSHSDDDGTNVHSEYFSCHHLVFILPALTRPVTVSDFPLWAWSAHTLPDLFVPDRPQRPPLA